jgi:hypothetical protein
VTIQNERGCGAKRTYFRHQHTIKLKITLGSRLTLLSQLGTCRAHNLWRGLPILIILENLSASLILDLAWQKVSSKDKSRPASLRCPKRAIPSTLYCRQIGTNSMQQNTSRAMSTGGCRQGRAQEAQSVGDLGSDCTFFLFPLTASTNR